MRNQLKLREEHCQRTGGDFTFTVVRTPEGMEAIEEMGTDFTDHYTWINNNCMLTAKVPMALITIDKKDKMKTQKETMKQIVALEKKIAILRREMDDLKITEVTREEMKELLFNTSWFYSDEGMDCLKPTFETQQKINLFTNGRTHLQVEHELLNFGSSTEEEQDCDDDWEDSSCKAILEFPGILEFSGEDQRVGICLDGGVNTEAVVNAIEKLMKEYKLIVDMGALLEACNSEKETLDGLITQIQTLHTGSENS